MDPLVAPPPSVVTLELELENDWSRPHLQNLRPVKHRPAVRLVLVLVERW